jgi:hypothetical protein
MTLTTDGTACTAADISYSMTVSETSVFSFDSTTRTLSAYSVDTNEIGGYGFSLVGTLDSSISKTSSFTYNVYSKCHG